MQYRRTGLTLASLSGLALSPAVASAQTLDVSVTIPRINAAEYHRPYVALWLESEGAAPTTLSVWYDYDLKGSEGGGTKWLRDIRAWWRISGRTMRFPADGVTSATKAPGTHKVSFPVGRSSLKSLAPGNYTLAVEAAREVGGREVMRIPFTWKGAPVSVSTAGTSELGAVTLTIKR